MNKKVCVVTGGTRGIGFATVKAFLNAGYQVFLYGSRQETVDKALEALKGEAVEGRWTNLQEVEAMKADFEEIKAKYGSVDVLINNAGVSDATPLDKYTVENFDRIMDLNVKAPFVCIKAVLDIMKEQKHGVILNTSSMVSFFGQPSGVAYPTSKYAINGLTKSLSRELGKYNIRVNAVAPGITETDMVKNLPKEMIEPLVNMIPLHRIGKPEDIANAFLFLASEEANYITGAVLPVDGGQVQ
ncbi:SDR family NAD(P)-dependent oxidoreductase [Dubosiella newyorkensis]|nr:3-oxoacyl-ACP reductase family protein [Dubosiella newyorkensis]